MYTGVFSLITLFELFQSYYTRLKQYSWGQLRYFSPGFSEGTHSCNCLKMCEVEICSICYYLRFREGG